MSSRTPEPPDGLRRQSSTSRLAGGFAGGVASSFGRSPLWGPKPIPTASSKFQGIHARAHDSAARPQGTGIEIDEVEDPGAQGCSPAPRRLHARVHDHPEEAEL